MRRRKLLIGGGIAVAGGALYRKLRRRKPPAEPDPASELRHKLDESRAITQERDEFEAGEVPVDQAEPGIDEEALARIEARGIPVLRRPTINLFFGGVQAVAREHGTASLSGGGDPRRGGAVAYAD